MRDKHGSYIVVCLFIILASGISAETSHNKMSMFDIPSQMAVSGVADDSLCCRVMGDANDDSNLDISDLVFMVNYLFGGGPVPPCREQADITQDCELNIEDISIIVFYMFGGGFMPQECHYCPNWH